jgi:hypothetical protein
MAAASAPAARRPLAAMSCRTVVKPGDAWTVRYDLADVHSRHALSGWSGSYGAGKCRRAATVCSCRGVSAHTCSTYRAVSSSGVVDDVWRRTERGAVHRAIAALQGKPSAGVARPAGRGGDGAGRRPQGVGVAGQLDAFEDATHLGSRVGFGEMSPPTWRRARRPPRPVHDAITWCGAAYGRVTVGSKESEHVGEQVIVRARIIGVGEQGAVLLASP